MKKISLLHTVRPVLASFGDMLRSTITDEELAISNTLDEFLASDANIHGFTQNNLNQLALLLKAKELEQPDIIVVTCSTLSPGVEKIRPLIHTPIITIDEAMLDIAVSTGNRIHVLATAQSTIGPTIEGLEHRAKQQQKKLEITHFVCDAAYDAMRSGDLDTHDKLVCEAAATVTQVDVIVLAQASTGHLQNQIEQLTGIYTLSSPSLCVKRIKQILKGR